MIHHSCTIALDIGTTSVKAMAVTTAGEMVAHHTALLTMHTDSEGAAEQDPEEVYAASIETLSTVAAAARQAGHAIDAVGLSAAMHSILPVSADGRPLARALTWMDGRAERQAAALWESAQGPQLYAVTGTPIHAMAPLVKLRWLAETRPALFHATDRFVSLKEWLWWRFFRAWEVDPSMASATGLLDIRSRVWHADALAYAGIREGQLSELVPVSHVRTEPNDERLRAAGLGAVPFHVGASDGALAQLGLGLTDGTTTALTAGTSLAVRRIANHAKTDAASRIFCYILDDERYVIGAPSNSGGIVIDWLHRQLADVGLPGVDQVAALCDAAASVAADDLLCIPYVAGERAPIWDARASGAFIGLRLHHTPLHLVRAALEGIAQNAHWIADAVLSGEPQPKRLLVAGTLFETKWLRQVLADVFQLPVDYLMDTDASTLGAIHAARAALQLPPLTHATDGVHSAETLLPDPTARDAWQAKVGEFRRLVRVVSSSNV